MPERRSRPLVPSAIVVVLLIGLSAFTARMHPHVLRWSAWTDAALLPVDQVVVRVGRGARSVVDTATSALSAEARVARLTAEVRALRARVDHLAVVQSENARLRRLLGLASSLSGYRPVTATVTSRDPGAWTRILGIDRGSNQGIRVRDPVLATGGLVGRVLAVTPRSAQVLLVTDPESGIGAMDARSGDMGVLTGGVGGRTARLTLFHRFDSVRPGDLVVTSGLGGVAPRGIAVGRVLAVGTRQFGLVRVAQVRLSANLDALDHVLVLVHG